MGQYSTNGATLRFCQRFLLIVSEKDSARDLDVSDTPKHLLIIPSNRGRSLLWPPGTLNLYPQTHTLLSSESSRSGKVPVMGSIVSPKIHVLQP